MKEKMMEFTTAQDVNKHYRDIYTRVGIVGIVIEMWRDLAFKDKKLVLCGVPDSKASTFLLGAVGASGVERQLPLLLVDYMVFGRFIAHLSHKILKGYWTRCIPLDLDYCSVKVLPFESEPEVHLETSQEQQEWASSTDPRVVDQRRSLDPDMVRRMAKGEGIFLKPEDTLFFPRRAYASDYYGTSWLANIQEPEKMEPAELLFKLQVHLSKLHDDRSFQRCYVDTATRLRDHICDYVFTEKMFPTLVKRQNYPWKPYVAWMDEEGAELPRDIVIHALEKTGSLLTTLEEQQESLIRT